MTVYLLRPKTESSKLMQIDDVLWDVASQDDDSLGLDHVDRTRAIRNGAGDLFLR